MNKVWPVLIALILGMSNINLAHGEILKTVPHACRSVGGQYYNANLFPLYEYRNRRVILKDWSLSQPVRELETSLTTTLLQFLNWSPDCHYLLGAIGDGAERSLAIWDTVAGGRVATFPLVGPGTIRAYWKSSGGQVVVGTPSGAFLWTLSSNSTVQLVDHAYDRYQVRWDQRHNELFLMPLDHGPQPPGLTIYNTETGQVIASYSNPASLADISRGFQLFGHNHMVAVFTTISGTPDRAGVTLWDLNTSNNIQINAGTDGVTSPSHVALSLDGRYLAIVRRTIRVWDLQNLSGDVSNHTPVYTYTGPGFLATSAHFTDNTTLELVSSGLTVDMDVLTGAYVPVGTSG
jgi:WD40 repeat protein